MATRLWRGGPPFSRPRANALATSASVTRLALNSRSPSLIKIPLNCDGECHAVSYHYLLDSSLAPWRLLNTADSASQCTVTPPLGLVFSCLSVHWNSAIGSLGTSGCPLIGSAYTTSSVITH